MNNKIHPCIWCNHNAASIAGFYVSVFPDAKIVTENPVVAMISIGGQNIMLLNGGDEFRPTPALSLMFLSTSEEEIESIYNKLLEGGISLMPLGEYPFSTKYGWINDKYGVSWQLYTGKAEDIIQRVVPTLMFTGYNNGKAREAADFYMNIFPNSKLQGMLEYTGAEEETAGHIMHGEFMIDNYLIGIMDSSLDHKFNFTEGISLVVNCKDQQEIDAYWSQLIAGGGTESMCGWLKDKYGISWQILPENIGELVQTKNGGEALMKMGKIIITDLERANS